MIDPRKPDYTKTPGAPGRPGFEVAPADPHLPPVVSIVTPFHNPGEVFLETVTSVLRQTLAYWEWLIVDDASTDPRSLQLLEELAEREPRVRVLRAPENLGPGGARNLGFAQARAELVMQLDADDLLEPTYFEKAAWFLSVHPECAFVKSWSVGFGTHEYLWRDGFHSGAVALERNVNTLASMVRRSAHQAVGGYDASIRDGLEDWEFWLRSASRGFWGGTIPEFLDWYRRRDDHHVKWKDWDGDQREAGFRTQLREKLRGLYEGDFPQPRAKPPVPYEPARREAPFQNPLVKTRKRLLLIAPWLEMGGADKFNLRLIQQLSAAGWEVTIATTLDAPHRWMHEFTQVTPDVFALEHFLPLRDRPSFLRYLIQSRDPDVVLLSNSELGYGVLPWLRQSCPRPAYVDYCHMEEAYWKSGGYPRFAVASQEQLDLNVVSSEHLKGWMVERGADPARIEVCYTNERTEEWRRDLEVRAKVRADLGVSFETAVILFAGRICSQKQPRVLARVLAELARRRLDFVAVVAGDGEDLPWLETFVQEKDLGSRVRLLGAVPNERTRALMSGSDVYFLPSLWEGIALSVFEAMSMELAVVGADVGGQRELVTPEVGLLLPRATEDEEVVAYADALARLISQPAERRRMGGAARARVQAHFELAQMGTRMAALFEQAVALHQSAPRPSVPKGIARELADRAVEYARLSEVSDTLWKQLRASEQARVDAPPGLEDPGMGLAMSALGELQLIQDSRAWQMVERLKGTLPYRAVAQLRWGEDLGRAADASPEQELDRIKNSRAWRMITRVKRTPPYRWYASARREE